MMTGDWLKKRIKKAAKRPDVIVVHSIEGGGKTSFATNFPDVSFMFSENETGYITLASRGLVKECQYFPEFVRWEDVVDCTREMVDSKDRPRTLVVDTINGVESLLHSHVCRMQYDGEMGKKGFLNFQEGYHASVPLWRRWLSLLDQLRSSGTTIVLLAHTVAANFKNPEGADYHRYVAELHATTWAATKKFADMVVFLNFHTEVADVVQKRGKGVGGRTRVYSFERTAAFDAKHRHGLPPAMIGKGDTKKDFAEFVRLVKAGTVDEKSPGDDA